MSNPLGAILAGIGAGASSAGNSLTEEAILAAQNKRQAALDAIARQQKLSELGLTPTDSSDPGQAQNLSPVQQVAMAAQSPQDVVAAGKTMQPSDYALKQLIALPTATGGIQQYTQGKPLAEQLADERADAEEKRQEKFLLAQRAVSAVDPATLKRALAGDDDAIAEVLTKQPGLAPTLTKQAKPVVEPKQMAEYVTLNGKPVFQGPNGLQDGAGQPLTPAQVMRYTPPKEPKGPSAAQQATQDQLAGLLGPLQSADATLDQAQVPGAIQRGLSHIPGQPFVSDNTQLQQTAGQTWVANYMQGLKTRGMPLPTLDYMNKTYVPQPGDGPAVTKMKSNNRKAAASAIQARAQGQVPTVAPSSAFGDLIPKKPDDE